MTSVTWREKVGSIAVAVMCADALAYIVRLLMRRVFYEGHVNLVVILAEIGFLISAGALVLALIGRRRRLKIASIIGSIVLCYLWFSDIAWWVMVK
jgi:hypothetical protein